ncbi:hypothetical protein J4E86_003979 [Alternaria arbusti]|uniref:uncharacterized protein n=1 Tax=Alternaria arbusti TaxID=232088 RepID=UPI00222032CF|nr:uncharacterized protein J4E86_003979 [Alternaria arbusti]KAI4958379.1 hypothetical protein J4E86_003979 [Alternaria arbusti]
MDRSPSNRESLQPTSLGHSRSFSEESWDPVRAYTSSLGPPACRNLLISPKLSVTNISDAGDQQQLREERNLSPPEVSFDEDLAQSLASLPPLGDRYELQQEIMDARLSTRDNEGQIETFIPKAKLHLPLVKHDETGELYRKGDQICVPRGCFKGWSPLKLENFQRYQWWLLATYFSPPDDDGVVKNYKLQDQHILPFLTPGNALSQSIDKTGGYGRVIMVKIPSDHHNFSDTRLCERGFAVKQQVHDENRDAYKREIEILMKFSGGRSHPHIVSLLATYEQFNRFNLIFYRAEGDLFDYWKKLKPYPVLHHNNVNWFAKQCSGLVEGLSKLHKLLSFTKPQLKIEEEQSEYSYVEKDPELPGIRAKVNPRVTASKVRSSSSTTDRIKKETLEPYTQTQVSFGRITSNGLIETIVVLGRSMSKEQAMSRIFE